MPAEADNRGPRVTPADRLAEIEGRERAATKGPWVGMEGDGVSAPSGRVFETGCGCCTSDTLEKADATFIAHARADIPWLVERVRGLEAATAKLVHVLGVARDRAVALGDRVVEQGGADMNRGQFVRLVENAMAAAEQARGGEERGT